MRFGIVILLIFVLVVSGCTEENSNDNLVEESPGCVYNGVSNDPYPGQCGHYVDEDNNALCDLGE
jgi:hypothetical protein